VSLFLALLTHAISHECAAREIKLTEKQSAALREMNSSA
jgi:hypothetical protein